MDISAAQADGVARLTVVGELDLSTAGRLRTTGLASLEDATTRLTIDLSGVSFIDSTGLGALVEIKNAADGRGVAFVLVAPSERVLEVLRLTGMLDAFTID